MWNPMWSVCENNVWISSMWNSRCFAIHWGLSTCESPCETPCEVYENMCEFKWGFTCESLCETPCEVYVKICVKGLTSFHTLFTYISLCKISHACEYVCEIHVKRLCEKRVKRVWKLDNFHTFFHMIAWCFTYILLVVLLWFQVFPWNCLYKNYPIVLQFILEIKWLLLIRVSTSQRGMHWENPSKNSSTRNRKNKSIECVTKFRYIENQRHHEKCAT